VLAIDLIVEDDLLLPPHQEVVVTTGAGVIDTGLFTTKTTLSTIKLVFADHR
jgi:hypothetical protein